MSMQTEAYLLRAWPHNVFRLGKTSLDNTFEYIHSDTLFSAIMNTHAMMYGQQQTRLLKELFDPATDSGQISLSSAFHCLSWQQQQKAQWLFFFPKPLIYQLCPPDQLKQSKRIRFISRGLWQMAPPARQLPDVPCLGGTHALSFGELLQLGLLSWPQLQPFIHYRERKKLSLQSLQQLQQLEESQLQALFHTEKLNNYLRDFKVCRQITYPKVVVHQKGQQAAYYTQTYVQLQSFTNAGGDSLQTHFFFLLNLPDEISNPQKQQLRAAIRMLADEGIGGDRSSGAGHLQAVEQIQLDLPTLPQPNYLVNLSLSIPQNQEEFDQYTHYRYLLRGGGALADADDYGHQNQRQQIRMLAEGSMCRSNSPQPVGKLLSISPDKRPIFRNGLTFSIPFTYAH